MWIELFVTLFVYYHFFNYIATGGSFYYDVWGRTIEDIPNPHLDPVACGRPPTATAAAAAAAAASARGGPSSFCDPAEIFDVDIHDEIQYYINQATSANFTVVIIERMNLNGWTTTDPQLIADHFAYSLHQRWRRISSQEEEDGKDNGILIFLSTANRRVSVSIGSDVKPEIPSDVMEQFIKNTKSRSCEQLGTKDPFIPPPKNPVILEGPENKHDKCYHSASDRHDRAPSTGGINVGSLR
eukprot:scaffold2642_cov183-Ochromonas_danica.AAC.5